jgi:hypothetical protein
MIIHQDHLLVLDYEPKSDILHVKWPDLVDVPPSVIRYSFTMLVNNINNYHITKMLIDSKGTLSNAKDDEYKPLALELARGLASTRLKRMARVISDDQLREIRNKNYTQEVQSSLLLNYDYREFEDKETASAWLMSNAD